jgi:transposase
MLALDRHRRYYCHRGVADMRKGFDALAGMVRNEFGEDPLSGDIFIFFNRRRTQVKLLSWETDGFCVYYKRLEKGTFELPACDENRISTDILYCILRGLSIEQIKYRKRYVHEDANVQKQGKTAIV